MSDKEGYANPDDYVERMGQFYSSEYVAKNQPWIRELPFHEWLERRRSEVKEG